MLVLTVDQPYAWAIIKGLKPIENRYWSTYYRGSLAIHAGETKAQPSDLKLIEEITWQTVKKSDLYYGVILGYVQLVDIVRGSKNEWASRKQFNWILENPAEFVKPIKVKGQKKLWNCDLI